MPKLSPFVQAGFLLAANLAAFVLFALLIEAASIHHHWVLVWLGGLFLAEAVGLEILRPAAYPSLRSTLRWTVVLTCSVGLARLETILACAGDCRWKLGAQFALSAGALAAPLVFKAPQA